MASVTGIINVKVNTAGAAGALGNLAAQMKATNASMMKGAATMQAAQLAAARGMQQRLNATGQWVASTGNMMTATGRMAAQFDKGTHKSMGSFVRSTSMANRSLTANSAINQLAAQRVRALQTQYMALGKEVDGVQRVMKVQPTGMMAAKEWGSSAEFANQRAILFRRNLTMGANSMINWGKNTQWAGRQMMVGMGIPMGLAAVGAVRAFKDIEAASISFKRVYGDATTSAGEKAKMLGTIQSGVAQEMTKYGIAVSDTLSVAAKAAATGQKGDALVTATRETMRLATLGQLDYDQALQSTIATQTAFGVSSKGMTRVTDFLNAAENQTILSMDDMTKAIPRVAPVIRGLGGDVEDLGVLMTALRAGGITAEQGANALKSGLGSLINPTSGATEAMEKFGIPLDKIVNTNKGDLIGTVQDFGKALGKLPKFEQQQALESLFGKYQYARMGALFKNINSKNAKETARLSEESSANLAKISENEMSQIADSNLTKFQGAIERLRVAAAPLGGKILGFLAPLIDGFAKITDFFATNDVAGKVLMWGAAFAGLAGVGTMLTGVFANFFGTMIKGAQGVHRLGRFMIGRPLPKYNSIADLEATAAQKQLGAAAEMAGASLYGEAGAARALSEALALMNAELRQAAGLNGAVAGSAARGVAASATAARGAAVVASTSPVAMPPVAATQKGRTQAAHMTEPSFDRAAMLAYVGTEKAPEGLRKLVGAEAAKVAGLDDATRGRLIAGDAAAIATHATAAHLPKFFNNMVADFSYDFNTLQGHDPKKLLPQASILQELDRQGTGLYGTVATLAAKAKGMDPNEYMRANAAGFQTAFSDLRQSVAGMPGGMTNEALGAAFQQSLGRAMTPQEVEQLGRITAYGQSRIGTRDAVDMPGNAGSEWQKYKSVSEQRGTYLDSLATSAHASAVEESTKATEEQTKSTKSATKQTQAKTAAEKNYASKVGTRKSLEAARENYARSAFLSDADRTAALPGTRKTTGTHTGDLAKLDDAIAKAKANEEAAYRQTAAGQAAIAKETVARGKIERSVNSSLAAAERSIGKEFSGGAFANKLFGVPPGEKAGRSGGGLWSTMRQGGAFTGDKANAWSGKLMGLGMAADLVTMGLQATGKEMPAWTHMIGMGMMTLGMFPGLIGKPAGALGAVMKKAAAPTARFAKDIGMTAAVVGSLGIEKVFGSKKPGEMFSGLTRFNSIMGKAGIIGSAIAVVSGTLYLAKEAMDHSINKISDGVAAQATSNDAVNAYAQEVGKETTSMKTQREVVSEAVGETVTQAEQAAVSQRMAGPAGQLMIQQVNKALATSPTAGMNSVVAQAAGLYGEGLTTRKETIQIAAELASVTGLEGQTVDIIGNLKDIIGGKGVDTPIEIQAKIGELAMSPDALISSGFKGAAEAPWYAQAFADWAGSDGMSGEEAMAAKGAGKGAFDFMQAGGMLSTSDAIGSLMRAFASNGDMQKAAIEELSHTIDVAFDNSLQYSDKGLYDRIQAAKDQANPDEQTRGIMEVKASLASGDMDREFANSLFSSDDVQKNLEIATRFDGMSSTDMAMIEAISQEKGADGKMSANAGQLASAIQSGADMETISKNMEAYSKLPAGARKSVTVEFGVKGSVDMVKGAVDQINKLPPNLQKKISLDINTEQEGQKLDDLLTKINQYGKKDISNAFKSALPDGILDNAKDANSVLNNLQKNAKPLTDIKVGVKANKIDTTGMSAQNKTINVKAKATKVDTSALNAQDKTIKVKAKATKVDTAGLNAQDKTIKVKAKMPKVKPQSVKLNYHPGKMPKPKAQSAKVNYHKGSQAKPKSQSAKVNYHKGSQAKPKAMQAKVNYDKGSQAKPDDRNAKVNYDKGSQEEPDDKEARVNYTLGSQAEPTDKTASVNYSLGSQEAPQDKTARVNYVGGSALGGLIHGFADGGGFKGRTFSGQKVSGPGGPEEDKVPAWLSPGEFVMRQKAVKKYGASFMSRINSGQLNVGPDGIMRLKDGTNKKDSKNKDSGSSGGSDKNNPVKDWRKELDKAGKVFDIVAKRLKGKKSDQFNSTGLAAAIASGETKVLKKFFGSKGFAKEYSKKAAKQIKTENITSFYDQEVTDQKTIKAAKIRIKGLSWSKTKIDKSILAAVSDEELLALKQLKLKGKALKKWVSMKKKLQTTEFNNWKVQEDANAKMNQTRMQISNRLGMAGIEMSDEEAKRWQQLKGKARKTFESGVKKRYDERKAFEEKSAYVERSQSLNNDIKANRAIVGMTGLSPDAMANLSTEDVNIMLGLTGKALDDFKKKLNLASAAADEAAIAMMKPGERFQDLSSSYDQMAQNAVDQQTAKADMSIFNKSGLTTRQLEAQMQNKQIKVDEYQHQNEQEQRAIDDINKSYDEQAKLLDNIEQAQQIISNIQKGRLNVASALSSGDIAAAAAAAQEQRSTESQANLDMMKAALEKERENKVKAHQNIIDDNQKKIDKISDEIWDTQHLIDSTQAKFAKIGAEKAREWDLMNAKLKTAAGYWEAINRQTQTHIDTVRRIARQKGEGAVIGPETQAERSQRLAEEEAERKRRAAAAAKERRRAAAAAAAAAKEKRERKKNIKQDAKDEVKETKQKRAAARKAADKTKSEKDDKQVEKIFNPLIKEQKENKKRIIKKVKAGKLDKAESLVNKMNDSNNKAADNASDAIKTQAQNEKKKEKEKKKEEKKKENKKKAKHAFGGFVGGYGNTDSINAMLTPGEFVMTKGAAARYGKALERINSPSFKFADKAGMIGGMNEGSEGNVYNVTINANGVADAEEIATITLKKIKELDTMRVREMRKF